MCRTRPPESMNRTDADQTEQAGEQTDRQSVRHRPVRWLFAASGCTIMRVVHASGRPAGGCPASGSFRDRLVPSVRLFPHAQ